MFHIFDCLTGELETSEITWLHEGEPLTLQDRTLLKTRSEAMDLSVILY